MGSEQLDYPAFPGSCAFMAFQFSMPFFSGRSPIGIDVGDDAVRAIQLDSRSGSIRAMARLPLPEVGARDCHGYSQLLRRSLRKQGFRGTRCVLSAPRDKAYSKCKTQRTQSTISKSASVLQSTDMKSSLKLSKISARNSICLN